MSDLEISKTNSDISDNTENHKVFEDMKKVHRVLMEKMFKKEKDINLTDNEGRTILHYAAENDDAYAVHKLIKSGADMTIVDKNGQTAFHIAVGGENFFAMEQFIKHGVDVDFPENGETLLFQASMDDKDDVMDFLINAGADVNKPSGEHDCTPLFLSLCGVEGSKGSELLIAAGANINVRNNFGETPLHYAASSGRIESVEMLIALKANINACSNRGNTPLHNAVISNYLETVELLLISGADSTIVNKEGRTPLQQAEFTNTVFISKAIARITRVLEIQKNMDSHFQSIQKYLNLFKQTKSLERKIRRHKLLH